MTKKSPLARSKQIRVVIADDHPVVREGISALVKSQKDMRVVSKAANGRQALQEMRNPHAIEGVDDLERTVYLPPFVGQRVEACDLGRVDGPGKR